MKPSWALDIYQNIQVWVEKKNAPNHMQTIIFCHC